MIEIFLVVTVIILGILAVEFKDMLQAVICLGGMCITLGILFIVLNALYVGVFQFLIYAGATIILFISVVMLTERIEK